MKFTRFGGLSGVNQKDRYKLGTFHSPPTRKGVYCFHPQFVEPFLYSWRKNRKDLDSRKRVFEYNGEIWTHMYFPSLDRKGYYSDHNKEWWLTHTRYLNKIISKDIARENRLLLQDKYLGEWHKQDNRWRSAWRVNGDKDHMEFFIGNKV